ncbi:RagB/SusD family nutrient uptake outer membrane protein [Dyadobacter sp. LHD-138]|uniref:RagB/SusD family nutrient uptake outer membrane protein n=1 Tax=Dyadobacter sp. LHD-138 TaxID=3071413 RepID=UPI0027E12E5F|nr:RagB/SusD family nutrient uptake outer membrane protein [Dyadobacter sp. LHD-138]MDQ6481680.1 RagB/SusD family nutrient uptake outer membrane protein [Dyadobacter sp. LHD-138]
MKILLIKHLNILYKTGLFVLSVLGCSLLVSCEDVLKEEPKSVAVETFFNTAAEIETAVNAIYSPLRSSNYSVYEATLECQSDFTNGRGSWAPLHNFQGLDDANITRVAGLWNAFYLSIRNANLVIKNAPNGKAISKADVDKYVTEAKFLRAFNYFQLVRNWAGVPLRTEANMDIADLKKSNSEEVYNLILSDLREAEAGLPDNPAVAGRPSKWSAKTMLADVYLTQGKFAEARDKAGEVMQSNKFALVSTPTKSDFQLKVWGPELVSTSEEIFYLKYARQLNQGNYMLWVSNHPDTKLFSFGGAYVLYLDVTSNYYKSWNAGDLRKALWDKINFGLGANTVVSSKFIDQLAVSQNGAGNDDPVYGYSDVLLTYAEASSRAGNGPTAAGLEALNMVHRRAFGKSPATPSDIDFKLTDYNAETFLDLVLTERSYEFQLEGKRWLDLKRTGKAKEAVLAATGKTIADKHFLWPLPVSEMNYNKSLDPAKDQNPGY